MDCHVAYGHSFKDNPDEFIGHVPSQLVVDVQASVPRTIAWVHRSRTDPEAISADRKNPQASNSLTRRKPYGLTLVATLWERAGRIAYPCGNVHVVGSETPWANDLVDPSADWLRHLHR